MLLFWGCFASCPRIHVHAPWTNPHKCFQLSYCFGKRIHSILHKCLFSLIISNSVMNTTNKFCLWIQRNFPRMIYIIQYWLDLSDFKFCRSSSKRINTSFDRTTYFIDLWCQKDSNEQITKSCWITNIPALMILICGFIYGSMVTLRLCRRLTHGLWRYSSIYNKETIIVKGAPL